MQLNAIFTLCSVDSAEVKANNYIILYTVLQIYKHNVSFTWSFGVGLVSICEVIQENKPQHLKKTTQLHDSSYKNRKLSLQ